MCNSKMYSKVSVEYEKCLAKAGKLLNVDFCFSEGHSTNMHIEADT